MADKGNKNEETKEKKPVVRKDVFIEAPLIKVELKIDRPE